MKLMVIDGNSLVNRAFYGVRPLSTSEGQPTNAIFGFVNILEKLLGEDEPDALCVTFDRPAPTFRHLAYDGYKATRHGMPEDLAAQMPVLKELLDAMRIPRYELDGWEADDLIGTISRRCQDGGWDCLVVTGDKDSLQLVSDATTVKLVTTRMGQTTTRAVTPAVFREEYGFDPIHIIDLKALMGDSSDNIPGVKGVGEKTAMALLRQIPSVAELYQRLDELELKPALRKKLTEGRELAELSYDLATIRRDAPIDFRPEDTIRKPADNDALYALFRRLEFTKFIQRFGLTPPKKEPEDELPAHETEIVELTAEAQTAEPLARWAAAGCVVVRPAPDLGAVTVSLAENGKGWLWELRRADFDGDYDGVLARLFSQEVKKVCHGVKELCRTLLEQGITPAGFLFDTELAAYLLDPTAGNYDLRKLAAAWFKGFETDYNAAHGPGFDALPEDIKQQTFLREENSIIAGLYEALRPKLEAYGLTPVLSDIELPLCPVLAEMEVAGVLVDKKALVSFGEMLSAGIAQSQEAIYSYAGEEFNINSTQQLGHILFEKLQLPTYKKTKRGYSTDAAVLEKLRPQHPIIDQILEYRQLTKLKSTYVDGLTRAIAADGRIHTSFQNTVTATGRLSSVEPNLQNIPVRTPLGAEMRKMFIAGEGNVLVDADYSQIELRLLAHIAGDEAMREGFRAGADIHTATASQMYGVPQDLVTKQMRSSAKAINFGIVYGISDFSLAGDLHVSRKEARGYMDRYFEKYAGVRQYMDNIVIRAREQGYVSTEFGRRRWLPELKSSNYNLRSFGERVALNMPIQGTAADIIKLAMVRVQARLKSERLAGRLVLQVHDELIVECPQAEGEQVAALLEEEMERICTLSVPLVAEAKLGRSWADAH